LPGDYIGGKYRIRGVLGVGGFGVVYEAEHVGLRRAVAVKVLHVSDAVSDAAVGDFRQEARIAALAHHPNLLEVHDTGTLDDGSPYLVMERVVGETLCERMSRGPLTVCDTLGIARQLLSALCALSAHGIVHCDIKPANLMLCDVLGGEQVLKLVDFGSARVLHPGQDLQSRRRGRLTGTPHYMSPEHLTGAPLTVQTDLYAAGVLLYECLTGRPPFDGVTPRALLLSALTCKPWPLRIMRPDCPRRLERVVATALQSELSRRYASPHAMLAAIEACLEERATARSAPATPGRGRFARRDRPATGRALQSADTEAWPRHLPPGRELAPHRATHAR
jgi:serine/threonine-protein kinase